MSSGATSLRIARATGFVSGPQRAMLLPLVGNGRRPGSGTVMGATTPDQSRGRVSGVCCGTTAALRGGRRVPGPTLVLGLWGDVAATPSCLRFAGPGLSLTIHPGDFVTRRPLPWKGGRCVSYTGDASCRLRVRHPGAFAKVEPTPRTWVYECKLCRARFTYRSYCWPCCANTPTLDTFHEMTARRICSIGSLCLGRVLGELRKR